MSTNAALEIWKHKVKDKDSGMEQLAQARKGMMQSYDMDLKIQDAMSKHEGPSFSDALQKNMDLLYKGRENARRSPLDMAFANMATFLDGAKDKKKLETLAKLRENLIPLQQMEQQVVKQRLRIERNKMAAEQLNEPLRMYAEQGASMLPEDRVKFLRNLAERYNALTGNQLQVEGVDGHDFMKAFVRTPEGQIVKMDFGQMFPDARVKNDQAYANALEQEGLAFAQRQQDIDAQRTMAYAGGQAFQQNPYAQGVMAHSKEMGKQNAKSAKEVNDEINAATDRLDSTDRLIKAFEDAIKRGAVGSSYAASLKRSFLESTGETYELDRIKLEMNDLMKGIREVFGGGVLSDQDIALYKQGIASIEKNPQAVIEALNRTKQKLSTVKDYLMDQRQKTINNPSANPFTPRAIPLTDDSVSVNTPPQQPVVQQKPLAAPQANKVAIRVFNKKTGISELIETTNLEKTKERIKKLTDLEIVE